MSSLFASPRNNLTDRLTTFLVCQINQSNRDVCKWEIDRKLIGSLIKLCQDKKDDLDFQEDINVIPHRIETIRIALKSNDFNKSIILKHLLQDLEQLKLNRKPGLHSCGHHLIAYLEESCFRAAKEAFRKLANIPHQYTEIDLLNIAREYVVWSCKIAESDDKKAKLFERFDWRQRVYALDKYVREFIQNKLRTTIEQEYGIQRRTDWGWLKKIEGQRARIDALELIGIKEQFRELYFLVWQSFDLVYSSNQKEGSNRLSEPTLEQYQQMANYYNQKCKCLKAPGETLDCKGYKEKLQVCINAAKAKGAPIVKELKPIGEPDEPQAPGHTGVLIDEKFNEELQNFTNSYLQKLDSESSIILELKNLNFTDQNIGDIKNTHQTTITRKNKKIFISFSQELVEHIKQEKWLNLETSKAKDSLDKTIDRVKNVVKNYLELYYHQKFDLLLAKLYQDTINDREKTIHQKFHESYEKELSEIEMRELERIQECLQKKLQEYVVEQFNIPKNKELIVADTLSGYLKDWLERNSPQQIMLIAER